MSNVVLEVTIIAGLLLLNGLFAMSEIAIVTARRGRLETLARSGNASAKAALKLAAEPTAFLSSAQIGITLIGILAGAFGGARVATAIEPMVADLTGMPKISDEITFGLVVAAITYLSLVMGELVPKRLALGSPEKIAMMVAKPMQALARFAAPAVWLLTISTHFVLRIFRVKPSTDHAVTEDDIRALVRQASAAGSMHAGEAEIVVRALRLGDRPVGAVMTPRTDVVWLDLEANEAELRQRLAAVRYRMVPVCTGSLDKVQGLLRIRDLLPEALAGDPLPIQERVLPPLFVPETLTLLRLIEQFRTSTTDAAIVLDEYGGMAGMVTRTDVLDELAAGLPGQPGHGEELIVRRKDGTWLVDGGCSIHDMEDRLGVSLASVELEGVKTVAGLVQWALGRIPQMGESADVAGHRFEVIDLDGNRIDRLLVSALPAP